MNLNIHNLTYNPKQSHDFHALSTMDAKKMQMQAMNFPSDNPSRKTRFFFFFSLLGWISRVVHNKQE
jgi:hypothetical protein